MIELRELRDTDAPLMLEWMHDADIQRCFQKNMQQASLEDACSFCAKAKMPDKLFQGASIHFAIVDDTDEYLGTISLKDIDLNNGSAEYAIAMRKKAQGKGIAYRATGLLLDKAFNEYDLHRVYLNVLADNRSAIKLYERCGFTFEGEFREHIKRDNVFVNLKWYGMTQDEYDVLCWRCQ